MEPKWLAVWTRSRHEKLVRDHLDSRGVEVFLPLLTLPSRRRDRSQLVEIPAFACYLFARIEPSEAHVVKTTRGVVRLLGPTPMEFSVVPDADIEAVRTMVESSLRIDPFPYLKVGSRVRVKNGPLKGIEGTLVKKNKRLRVVVCVELLSQAISAEVSADDIEAA